MRRESALSAVGGRSPESRARAAQILVASLVAAGVLMRLVQFAANRSLWIDEAALALNMIERPFSSMTARLDYAQMAPIGFLWLEKTAVSLLGTSEPALRLVPLVAGILALVLFAWLSWNVLRPLGAVVAVGLFAANRWLIYYSSEVKQYSTDVLATVGLLAAGVALNGDRSTPRRLALLAVLGTLAGWLSHPACFVLAGIGVSMLWTRVRSRDRPGFAYAVALCVWWVVTVLPILLLERGNLTSSDRHILDNYWDYGLPTPGARLGEVLAFLFPVFRRAVSYFSEVPRSSLAMVALLIGIGLGALSLARRHFAVFLMVATPILLMLAAAGLREFPFQGRLVLSLITPILLFAGELFDATASVAPPRGAAVAWASAAALLGLILTMRIARVPEYRDELRPALHEVGRRARPEDVVYVCNGAIPAFRYYQQRLGLVPRNVFLGCCARDRWAVDAQALLRLGGRGRVWLILSQMYDGEDSFLLEEADRSGRRQVAIRARGASAYLYDLRPSSPGMVAEMLARIPPNRNLAQSWQCTAGGIHDQPSCGVP